MTYLYHFFFFLFKPIKNFIKFRRRAILKYHYMVTKRYHDNKHNIEGPNAVNFKKKQQKELRYFRDFIKVLRKVKAIHLVLIFLFVLYLYGLLSYGQFVMKLLYITVVRVKTVNYHLHLINLMHNDELYYLYDLKFMMPIIVENKIRSVPLLEIFLCEIDLQLGPNKPGFFDYRFDGWHRPEGWNGTRIERFFYSDLW